jgi:hypothetical protein
VNQQPYNFNQANIETVQIKFWETGVSDPIANCLAKILRLMPWATIRYYGRRLEVPGRDAVLIKVTTWRAKSTSFQPHRVLGRNRLLGQNAEFLGKSATF